MLKLANYSVIVLALGFSSFAYASSWRLQGTLVKQNGKRVFIINPELRNLRYFAVTSHSKEVAADVAMVDSGVYLDACFEGSTEPQMISWFNTLLPSKAPIVVESLDASKVTDCDSLKTQAL